MSLKLIGIVIVLFLSGCTNIVVPDNNDIVPDNSVIVPGDRDSTPQETILVSGCEVLDKQGVNYILDSDIIQTINTEESLRCIIIEANDITLDCQNHSIIGDDYDHSDYLGLSWGIATAINEKFNSDYRFENITVKNCKMDNFSIGVRLRADNSLVTSNELNTGNVSVNVWGSNNTISNNVISSEFSSGIELGGSKNTVENNTLTNSQRGIEIFGTNQTVKDNKIENNGAGIRLTSTNSTIENNVIKNNDRSGIDISNNINTNERGDNKIIGNIIESNGQWGMYIEHSPGNVISNNKISGHSLVGIYFAKQSPENTLIGNEVFSNGTGLSLTFKYPGDVSNDITLTDNKFCDNKRGNYENDSPDFDCDDKKSCKRFVISECLEYESIPRTIDGGGNTWGGTQETICGITRATKC